MARALDWRCSALLLWMWSWTLSIDPVHAQASCPSALKPSYPAPILAQGYKAQLVAHGFRYPRGIRFDSEGALLVVDAGNGIVALTLEADKNDSISVSNTKILISNNELGHGIEMSPDGTVSKPEEEFSKSPGLRTHPSLD